MGDNAAADASDEAEMPRDLGFCNFGRGRVAQRVDWLMLPVRAPQGAGAQGDQAPVLCFDSRRDRVHGACGGLHRGG